MLFKGDIDEWNGVGNQKRNGFIVRTFKRIYQLRTSREIEINWFEYINNLHERIKLNMEYQLEEKKKRKEAKKNRSK